MSISILERNVLLLALLAGLVSISTIVAPMNVRAAGTCTFSTNLDIGVESEAVRCLQQYLNTNGFMIAATGVGSLGHETTQFKEKTQAAVKAWQSANGITPVTGTFGPISRAKYLSLVTATTPIPTPTPTLAPTPTPAPVTDVQQESSRKAIIDARSAYKDAQNTYEDAKADGDSLGGSKSLITESGDALLAALYAFIDKDYTNANKKASTAKAVAKDALDEIDGGSSSDTRDEAKDAIADAKSAIADAKREISDADESNRYLNKAEDLLDEAKDSLSDAEDSYDAKEYDDAIGSANDAKDSAEEAIDVL